MIWEMMRTVSVEDWCWSPCDQVLKPERFFALNFLLKVLSIRASCSRSAACWSVFLWARERSEAILDLVFVRCLSSRSQSGSIRGEQGKCFPRIVSALSVITDIIFEYAVFMSCCACVSLSVEVPLMSVSSMGSSVV